MRALRTWLILPIAAVMLTACPPPIYPTHIGDYDLAYAKAYFGDRERRESADLARLSLEQLYALYRFGRERIHHPPNIAEEIVRRGAESANFLRPRLEQAQNRRAVDAILTLLRALQREGTFDVRRDPTYVALIQRKAAEQDDKLGRLRDLADNIETATELPSTIGSWTEPLFGGGDGDFDEKFAENYCRGCDYRETIKDADRLTIEQLYAVQRFNWDQDWPRNFNRYMAQRGPKAVALFKRKLAGSTSGEMLWTILGTLELMRDLGTYDVAGDAELMQLAGAAVARLTGWRKAGTEHILERIKTGAKHPFLKVEER